jgi:hypothetical protein
MPGTLYTSSEGEEEEPRANKRRKVKSHSNLIFSLLEPNSIVCLLRVIIQVDTPNSRTLLKFNASLLGMRPLALKSILLSSSL